MLTDFLSRPSYNILTFDTSPYPFNVGEHFAKTSVQKIVEDANGKLWLVTPNGLSRLDPKSFTNNWSSSLWPESIFSDHISCVYCDSKGAIWVGTRTGLNQYNPETDTFTLFRSDPNDLNSLSDNSIRVVIEDKVGNIWIGTANGLNLLNLKDDKVTITRFLFSKDPVKKTKITIYDLHADPFGIIWAATSEGLAKVHGYGIRPEIFKGGFLPGEKAPKVLLAGGNKELKSLFRETFEDRLHIIEPGNPAEAWDKILDQVSESTIAIATTADIKGMALLKKIKTDTRTSHLPLVLLTSKSAMMHDSQKLKTGANYDKPLPFFSQLSELDIKNILDSNRSAQQLYDWQSLIEHNTGLDNSDISFIKNLVQIVEEHISDRTFTIPELTTLLGMSQSVIYKKVKVICNTTVNDFIKIIKLNRASELLDQNKLTVNEISLMVGFEDRKYFSREFRKQFGVTPKNWQRNR